MKERKTKITVESYEVLVIKQRGSFNRLLCAACGKQAVMIGAQFPPDKLRRQDAPLEGGRSTPA